MLHRRCGIPGGFEPLNAYASRAPRPPGAVVCRDADVARERFGVDTEETGAIYTRTGRAFLDGREQTEAALARVRAAADAAGLWEALDTGWLVLDCELLPWSAKAMQLIRRQYAAVGAAARAGLSSSIETLERAAARDGDRPRGPEAVAGVAVRLRGLIGARKA
jgi:hypothetical protein